jgi:hypothetical protein
MVKKMVKEIFVESTTWILTTIFLRSSISLLWIAYFHSLLQYHFLVACFSVKIPLLMSSYLSLPKSCARIRLILFNFLEKTVPFRCSGYGKCFCTVTVQLRIAPQNPKTPKPIKERV